MTDPEFLTAFEDLTLPFEQWTHRAHVKVGYCYLKRYSFEEALNRMRTGIKAYNASHNVPESATRGYNETTTHALLHLIAATMQAYGSTHETADADSFCDTHPQLMTKHVLRLFYSPQRRMHRLAKTEFIEPDLAPLPHFEDEARPRT
jgi:outer membrane protein assembly factor BamD (BamD/ComL family)